MQDRVVTNGHIIWHRERIAIEVAPEEDQLVIARFSVKAIAECRHERDLVRRVDRSFNKYTALQH